MRRNPPRVFKPQKVVAKLARETAPAFKEGMIATDPVTLMSGLTDYMNLANEVFLILFISARNHVVGYTEFTSGDISSVVVHPAGVFQAALLGGAAGIITVHNHPSGDATPSSEDRALWERLRDGGKLVGIPVVDNLVIGDGRYFSEAEGSNTDRTHPIPSSVRRST
jgi:DNA repair protein RadC